MKKTILVTGAAVRIGREIALTFAKDGWNIIIHCNSSTEKAEALAKEIEGISGITALAADTDGIDGFEKNAGAIISGKTFKILKQKEPSKDFLKEFDSFSAHEITSSLLYSGTTGINLNDIRIAIVR